MRICRLAVPPANTGAAPAEASGTSTRAKEIPGDGHRVDTRGLFFDSDLNRWAEQPRTETVYQPPHRYGMVNTVYTVLQAVAILVVV